MTTEAQIVLMERAQTKSGNPMWRLETSDGERVNVFKHRDPSKNSFLMFSVAGYGDQMKAMEVGERLRWQTFPIEIAMIKNGQWFEIVRVASAPEGAAPDETVVFLPDVNQYRAEAALWAARLLATYNWVVWDTETTGLSDSDEILTAGGIDWEGKLLNIAICPQQLEKVEAHTEVHGVTREQAEGGLHPAEAYWMLRERLDGCVWVIYNSEFDTRMLENFCLRHGMSPILPLATVDVVPMFAKFACEWDSRKARLKYFTLKEAAEYFGIFPSQFHSAYADAETTLQIIHAMAQKAE